MKKLNLPGLVLSALLLTNFVSAQSSSFHGANTIGSSPAYIILASHKSKTVGELEKLLADYTAYSPQVLSKQFELEITQREMAKVLVTPETKKSLLSDAFGKLLVRKISSEASLRNLLKEFTFSTPQVREKSSELQAIENELAKILLN